MSFLDELRHRTLWQVLIVYVGASWVLLQAIDVFANNLDLPGWVFPTAVTLLLVGLPIILATTLIQRRLAATGEVADEVHEKLFTWRNALLGGAGAFLLLFGFAGLYVVVQDRGETFRPADALADEAIPGIAVLPFAVRGLEEEIWGEGIAEVLPVNLEGVPGIRPISHMTVLARWRERTSGANEMDEATALEIARASGARYAVISGSLARAGDQTRIAATIVDLESGSVVGQPRVEHDSDDQWGLVDRFTVEVVRLVGTEVQPEYRSIDLRDATTESIEALRYYLAGSHQARRGNWVTAIAMFDSAVGVDPSFALAVYGLGHSTDGEYDGVRSVPLLLDAQRLTTSPRLDLLIRGALAEMWAYGYAVPGVTRTSYLRTIDELREAVRRNPEDPEMWNWLGEALWHGGAVPGLLPAGREQAAEAFTTASKVIPDFNTGHLFSYVLATGDSTLARQLIDHQMDPENSLQYRLRYRLFFESMSESEAVAALDSLRDGPYGLFYIVEAVRDAPLANTRTAISSWARNIPRRPTLACAIGLMTGRIEWFFEQDWEGQSVGMACLPYLDDIDLRGAAGMVAQTMESVDEPWVAALYEADDGRLTALERLVHAHEDSTAGTTEAGDPIGEQRHRERRQFATAYLTWRRGEAEGAARILDSIPRPLELEAGHFGRNLTRPAAASIYRDAGRLEDAAAQLEAQFTDSRMPQYLDELGRIYEELGDREKARGAYSLFLDRWRDADSILQPRLEAARDALTRLGPADE